jgi:hypothetical protein
MLRIFLFGLAKRRKQLERYVQYDPKIIVKWYKTLLTKELNKNILK